MNASREMLLASPASEWLCHTLHGRRSSLLLALAKLNHISCTKMLLQHFSGVATILLAARSCPVVLHASYARHVLLHALRCWFPRGAASKKKLLQLLTQVWVGVFRSVEVCFQNRNGLPQDLFWHVRKCCAHCPSWILCHVGCNGQMSWIVALQQDCSQHVANQCL